MDRKIVIFGAGEQGKKLLFKAINSGIYISNFCDSNPKLGGAKLFNKKIIRVTELELKKNEYMVVISSPKYEEEIKRIIRKIGVSEGKIEIENASEILKCANIEITNYILDCMIRDSINKEIIVIGTVRNELIHILQMLDINVNIELSDLLTNAYGGEEAYSIKQYNSGQYFFIVLPDCEKFCGTLRKSGFKFIKDWKILSQYKNYNIYRKNYLDINLLHTKLDNCLIPGFTVFGDINCKNKIVILGNSTSDEADMGIQMWPEYLYEICKNKKLNDVVIYNGAVNSYKSSQELVKLIRDVVYLSPTIVIEYGGVNEVTYYNQNFPFLNKRFLDWKDAVENSDIKIPYEKHVAMGVDYKGKYTPYQYYKMMIEMMNAVCKIIGTKFACILQPTLAYKYGKFSLDEKSLILNQGLTEKFFEPYINFRKEYYENKVDIEYYWDKSTLMDEEKNVYIDHVHLNEYGNYIVAKSILKSIEDNNFIIKSMI